MTCKQSSGCVNEVIEVEEDKEVDLCLVCCSKIKTEQNNSQLLAANLIVFYLVRRVLQVSDNELKRSLIGCGSPGEWIRLCDKCGELTRQAEELYRKLKRIERELDCVEQLIWNKTSASINCEADRKLVEETIDLTNKSSQVWRRIRNHVANKSNLGKRSEGGEKGTWSCPFAEGDKLANYLSIQKSFTAILPQEHSNEIEGGSDEHGNLEETNVEATSSEIKIEVDPEIKSNPSCAIEEDDGSMEHLAALECILKLEESELDLAADGTTAYLGQTYQDKHGELAQKLINVEEEKGKEEDEVDWNWDPDELDEDDEGSELNEEETLNGQKERNEEDTKAKEATFLATSLKREKQVSKERVKKGPPPSSSKKRRSTYIKKGRHSTMSWRTEDGRFKCRHCDQTFLRDSGRNSHEREKHAENPGAFVCDLCGSTFNSRCYLRKHSKRSHPLTADGTPKVKKRKLVRNEDGKYQCRHCDQVFVSSSGVDSHERDKHSKTPGAFVCDICGRAFNSAGFLRSHKTCSHKLKADGTPIPPKPPKLERDQTCEQCGKGFKTPKQMKRHVRFVHEKRFDISCVLCGSGWPSRNSLKKHMLALHREKPLTEKLVEEEGLGLWKCPVKGCTVRLLKASSLKAHLRSRHGKGEEEVEGMDLGREGVVLEDPSIKATCSICGKVCRNNWALKKHEELHGKEKDVICEICGKGFICKEYLSSHVNKTHLRIGVRTEKEFKCHICGKAYTYGHLLKIHLELHEKEGKRDYFCDKCKHGFVTETYLRVHLKRTNCGKEGGQARVYNRKGD